MLHATISLAPRVTMRLFLTTAGIVVYLGLVCALVTFFVLWLLT